MNNEKMLKNNVSKLTKNLTKVSKLCEDFRKAIVRRKRQQSIDADFKNYIKEKYPKIYDETVKAQKSTTPKKAGHN